MEKIEYLPNSQKSWEINNQQLHTSIIVTNLWENIWKIYYLYEYVEENKLLSIHLPGFLSNDSRINQLLSIVHNLYKAVDTYLTLETRAVFLNMSKTFDKVWHQRLIFRLKSVGVSDSLLSLTESFLRNRFQRVRQQMVRHLNGYLSKLVYHKVLSLVHFFS